MGPENFTHELLSANSIHFNNKMFFVIAILNAISTVNNFFM